MRQWFATITTSLAAVGLAFFGACSDADPDDRGGVLEVQTVEQGLEGVFSLGETDLRFRSREVEPGVVDIVVQVRGLDLTALVDTTQQVAEIDGFTGEGIDTQIVAADRELLAAFVAALGDEVDPEDSLAASVLHRVSSNWSQTPDTVLLQRGVAGSEQRGYTSICSYYGKYLLATHDDNNYNAFAAQTSSYAHVGDRSGSTYYYVNNKWITTTQDHKSYLYEYGQCYGNCGAGCPGGKQTLSLDCHDHDQCVRNGHAIASLWCNDEFVSASDDEFFAPTCSGT